MNDSGEIVMHRPHLRDIPAVSLPAGYRIRAYRSGDGPAWTEIQRESDEYNQFDDQAFDRQYPSDEATRARRIFFVDDPEGHPIGTVAAWFGEEGPAGPTGMIHWLAVRPAHQRKGLGQALLAHALHVMATMHQRAELSTDSRRLGAVKLYRQFGFSTAESDRPDS